MKIKFALKSFLLTLVLLSWSERKQRLLYANGFSTSTLHYVHNSLAGGGTTTRRRPTLAILDPVKVDNQSGKQGASTCSSRLSESSDDDNDGGATSTNKKDNKAMAFLRKLGKVGGASKDEFLMATGSDEGTSDMRSASGMKAMRKSVASYVSCADSGVIDDITDTFPFTSSGTEWAGFTDRVMGGISSGSISREVIDDKECNVLRGKVSLRNNGGFVQMATNLSKDLATSSTVDASKYNGIELDVLFQEGDECVFPARPGDDEPDCNAIEENFNIHLKTTDCTRQFSSYRATFTISQGSWQTVRIPWSSFVGYGPGTEDIPLNTKQLKRLGLVAIGKEMNVFIALAGLRFY